MFHCKYRRFLIVISAAFMLATATNLQALVFVSVTCQCCCENHGCPKCVDGNGNLQFSIASTASVTECNCKSGIPSEDGCCESQAKCKCNGFCNCKHHPFSPRKIDILWTYQNPIELEFAPGPHADWPRLLPPKTNRKFVLPIANDVGLSFVTDYCTWLCRFLI